MGLYSRRTGSYFSILIFFLITLNFFLLEVPVLLKSVPQETISLVILHFTFSLVIQCFFLAFIERKCSNRLFRAIIYGLVLTANIFSNYLIFYEGLVSRSFIEIITVLCIISLVSGVSYFWLIDNHRFRSMVLYLFMILIAINLFQLKGISSDKGNESGRREIKLLNKKIDFSKFADIHLISFDSMVPLSLAQKHMQIEKLGYVDHISQYADFVYKNMFASYVPSLPSLNSVLRLANPSYEASMEYFSGRKPSVVFEIFHDNGYRIATGYSNADSLFGKKGSYVDEYRSLKFIKPVSSSILCEVANRKEKILRFFGICLLAPNFYESAINEQSWTKVVVGVLDEKITDDQHWFTVHYIYNPIGHTSLAYSSDNKNDLKEYTVFFEKQAALLEAVLKEVVNVINKNNPKAIILIFGDHGPWLSRTIKFEEDSKFFVQDRHGVFGAILKAGPCDISAINHYANEYTTPERVLAGMIRCLASNPNDVDEIMDFKEPFDFSNYLYE